MVPLRLTALIASAAFALVVAAPNRAGAVDTNTPSPTPQSSQSGDTSRPAAKSKKKKAAKKDKKSEQQFIDGYRAAHATIYQRHDYAAGIAALKALGRDDNPDVANLIGYSSRKLGRYDDAKTWYERALAADPSSHPHLVVLRHVARRAGQSAQGARLSRQGRDAVRHRLPRIHRAQGRDRRHARLLDIIRGHRRAPGLIAGGCHLPAGAVSARSQPR